MKPSRAFSILGLGALLTILSGCGGEMYPSYSDLVQYGLRQDPILMQAAKDLGDERFDPDRPGVFPVMKFEDIYKPDNPMAAKADEIAKRELLRDPTKISAADRAQLEKALDDNFGTPARPKVGGVDPETVKLLQLDDATLAEGSKRYRVHCLHCHGVPGDGRGPTSRWINPHPRDFRAGMFKFQSVDQAQGTQRPAHRSDLLRTLTNGLEGTAMPSFRLLEDKDLEYLVSYVIHLSIRGYAEMAVMKSDFHNKGGALEWAPSGDEEDTTPAARVKLFAKIMAKRWKDAQDPANAIKVAPYKDADLADSVKRGKNLFLGVKDQLTPRGDKANCVSCHADYGRQAKFRFDDWGTLVRPNNFTQGVFRGGRRPVDMYYRVHSGISGSGMTPFGTVLEPQDIWDLINFVSNLSYPGMRDKLKININ